MISHQLNIQLKLSNDLTIVMSAIEYFSKVKINVNQPICCESVYEVKTKYVLLGIRNKCKTVYKIPFKNKSRS